MIIPVRMLAHANQHELYFVRGFPRFSLLSITAPVGPSFVPSALHSILLRTVIRDELLSSSVTFQCVRWRFYDMSGVSPGSTIAIGSSTSDFAMSVVLHC